MESLQAAFMQMLQNRKDLKLEDALPVIDAATEAFSNYMKNVDSPARGALSNPERALIRTFIVALLREKI